MAAVPPAARRVCTVCCQQVAQYTCPRCHKPYCSSACYKRHGQQCTELFYQEQAIRQMKSTVADKQQQQHMMLILQRLHEQGQLDDLLDRGAEDDDDDSSSDSDDAESHQSESYAALRHMPALKQLVKRATRQGDAFDIEPADITAELVAELEHLSLAGHLSHLVTPWQPWWNTQAAAELQLNAAGQRVIAELVQQQQQQAASGAEVQQGLLSSRPTGTAPQETAALPEPPAAPLPSQKALAGPSYRPSPLLPWQLLQLLAAYCAVLRLYNGDPDSSDSSEAAELLLQLAPPLSQLLVASAAVGRPQQQQQAEPQAIAPPTSVRSACMQLSAAASELSDLAGGPTGQKALLQLALSDASRLLELGRSTVLLALTDSKRILDDSTHSLKFHMQSHQPTKQHQVLTSRELVAGPGDKQMKQQLRQLKQQLKLAAHKLMFFSVWCNEQAPEMYDSLAAELVAEVQEQQQVSGAAGGAQAAPFNALVMSPQQAAKQAVVLSAQPAIEPRSTQEPLILSKQQSTKGQSDRGLNPAAAKYGAERVDSTISGGAPAMAAEPNGSEMYDQGGRGHEQAVLVEAGKHSVGRGGGDAAANVADNNSTSSLYDLD